MWARCTVFLTCSAGWPGLNGQKTSSTNDTWTGRGLTMKDSYCITTWQYAWTVQSSDSVGGACHILRRSEMPQSSKISRMVALDAGLIDWE